MSCVISNIISSCLLLCLTCMSGNDCSYQSDRESNLKRGGSRKLRNLVKHKTGECLDRKYHCIQHEGAQDSFAGGGGGASTNSLFPFDAAKPPFTMT